jgi:heme/copper-type cytochrome/quinol oxidase subunit 2
VRTKEQVVLPAIIKSWCVVFGVLLVGCSASQQFVAVPAGVNRDTVPKMLIRMTAERFKFVPETITIKEGTLVQLQITASDGDHGFQLGAFGIDERLEENETKTIEFYASKRGEYGFRCSHFCGLGHTGMTGKFIIE